MSLEIKARDVIFKSKTINSWQHLATYNEYVKKDGALIVKSLENKHLVEVNKAYYEYEKLKLLKGGRPGTIARNLIFSLPPKMEALIDRHNDKEMREMIDFILKGFFDGVMKQHPKINLRWLKEYTAITLHRDTNHTHFHIIAPCIVPDAGLFNNKLIRIDYAKRNISIKARRTLFNYCKSRILDRPITEADFVQLSQKEKAKAHEGSWKRRKDRLKDDVKEALQATQEANEKIEHLSTLYEENEKWIAKWSAKIQRLEGKIERGEIGASDVEDEKAEMLRALEKTKDEPLKEILKNTVKKVIYNGPKM